MQSTSKYFFKKKIYGDILNIQKYTGPKGLVTIKDTVVSWIVLYVDDGDTGFTVSFDGTTINFTPANVYALPISLADFQGTVPLLPMIAYTDGTVYVVVMRLGVFAENFGLSINPPSGKTINASWEVITNEQ